MDIATKLLGVALVVLGVGFPVWRVAGEKDKTSRTRHGGTIAIGFLSVFAGLALILADRITVLTLRGVGTIRAVTAQAIVDAGTVTDIRKQVEQIKSQVETGRDTVDLVASEAKKAKDLSEVVDAQSKEAEKKLEILNSGIVKANQALQELKDEADFQSIILAAQNDDRLSFDKLKSVSEDRTSKFRMLAEQAWLTIFNAHSNPMSLSGFTVPWPPGIDPSKLSMSELHTLYKSVPSTLKPAVLEYIWKRDDIEKIVRLDFMMEVMKTDPSLTAEEYAGRYFTQGTGQNIKAMALDYLIKWWDEHRQEFVGK